MDDERVPKGRLPSTPGSTPTRVVYLLGGALEPSEDGQVVGGVERQIARVVWGVCDGRREGTKGALTIDTGVDDANEGCLPAWGCSRA